MTDKIMQKLKKKQDNTEQIAKTVIEEKTLLPHILRGISSSNPRIKFKCAKILHAISEKSPETLYPHFVFSKSFLTVKNNIIKWNAIDVIANLTTVDAKNKFNEIFKKFYSLLDEGNLITAAHVVDGSGKIAKAKSKIQSRITKELLRVENVHYLQRNVETF